MAFMNLKKCLSSPNQLLKVLILVGCLLFAIYQVAKCIEKLLNPPISTYYGFGLNDTMRYPAITICRRPAFKEFLFSKYSVRRTQSLLQHNIFRKFNFTRYSIEDFLNETTYHWSEVFGLYAYSGQGGVEADADWMEFQTVLQGRCFTWTARTTSSVFSISGGWWFYLYHDRTVRKLDDLGVSQYGFHVFIHSPNEVMTSENEQENTFLDYIYLEGAEDMRVSLKYQSFKRVSSKTNICVDNDPNYSRSRCLEQCLHQTIAENVNCTLPWLWLMPNSSLYPQCATIGQVNALIASFLPHNRIRLVANCTCPPACEVTIYTPAIISRKDIVETDRQFPNSFIAMYYTNNIVTHMSEMVGYNINGFVSDIGGSLGFLLGLSVIGCISVIEKMFCSISTYLKSKKKAEEQVNQKMDHPERDKNDMKKLGKENEGTQIRLYDNLRDFDSDDFRCYERTLIGETKRF